MSLEGGSDDLHQLSSSRVLNQESLSALACYHRLSSYQHTQKHGKLATQL